MQNDTATSEKDWAVCKQNNTLTVQSSSHAPWYLPKWVEKVMSTEKPAMGCF